MKHLVVRPAAREDVRDASAWLEAQRAGLGARFESAVAALFRTIAERPLSFPEVAYHARRAIVDGFPYLVVFVDLPDEVRVVTVMHAHRDPKAVVRRISQDASNDSSDRP